MFNFDSLFFRYPLYFFSVFITSFFYSIIILYSDVHTDTSCCCEINFTGIIHLQGSILLVRRKQKQTAYPTVFAARLRPQHADHRILLVVAQFGLYAAPALCLDERCVLMRAVWEFNEARWQWAWSYGRLSMWDALRGFLLLCLYELDTFIGLLYKVCVLHMIFFSSKELHLCGVACDPELNCFKAIIWPKRPRHR